MSGHVHDPVVPYRILFPVGVLGGALGVSVWIFFQYRWIGFYPRAAHANLMYFGFLWPFVAGFLMTAIPRMTKSAIANWVEISLAVGLSALQFTLNLRNLTNEAVFLYCVQIAFLTLFLGRRLAVVRGVPFAGFVFLPAAIILASAGLISFVLDPVGNRDVMIRLAGEGFILNLIIGLGSRLIPVISRLPNALLPNERGGAEKWTRPLAVMAVINSGYVLYLAGFPSWGLAIRTIGSVAGAVFLLRLFERPALLSVIGIGLKCSLVFGLVGQVWEIFGVGPGLAAQHLTLIGFFSLVTLLISTRVTLAHGGQPLDYEVASPRLATMVLFLIVSAVLRFSSGAQPAGALILASLTFFWMGLGVWLHRFVLTPWPEDSPSS